MCGIAALLMPDGRITPATLRSMTRLIRHRGPDDEGYVFFDGRGGWCCRGGEETPPEVLRPPSSSRPDVPQERIAENNVPAPSVLAFGHRRLAIVDLSAAGHQPMATPDGRYWIVYNGELYNHRELRGQLEQEGCVFTSRSDTEVILQAFARWGPDCLSRFNGMWAFLIFDSRTNRLFGARDRFGIKPLYYWRSPLGGLAFASEIKQFTALPGWQARLNWQRAFEFLHWGALDHTGETLFDGVQQIPPGGCFQLSVPSEKQTGRELQCGIVRFPQQEPNHDRDRRPGELQIKTWYRLPETPARHLSLSDAAEELRDLLADAVRLRLRADVPVGSCLSGGLDSSSIVCLMHEQLRRSGRFYRQEAVSSCTDDPRCDERRFMEAVVRQTGIRTHRVWPMPETLFETLDRLTWHQDQPFGSTSIFAQWTVFAEAKKQGLIVMLDGQGADEQLAGYHGFYGSWFAELAWRGRWNTLRKEMQACRRMHGLAPPTACKQLAASLPVIGRFAHFVWRCLRRGGGGGSFLRKETFHKQGVRFSRAARQVGGPRPSLRSLSAAQLMSTNLPQLLHYEDRNSMAHSVESRVPFLDSRVVEHVFTLPGRCKIQHGWTKAVLREAMRGLLPECIVHRMDKIGFETPEARWFTQGAACRSFGRLLDRSCRTLSPLLNETQIRALWNDVVHQRRTYQPLLWRLVSFANWVERFEVEGGQMQPERPAQRTAA